ncbi:MAG: hypothetical protein HYR60_28640 [Acidobacteria bacterium]|nr:hypothetical protein [Acidobacteriota bacterium]
MCPVCRARFRSALQCPRCGADLEPLMRLAARAHALREEARRLAATGSYLQAQARVEEAQEMCATAEGNRLALLVRLLLELERPAHAPWAA